MTALEKLISDTNFTHCRQVANISRIIAGKAGYSTNEISIIEQAALLHDIGKGAIKSEILNKSGKLTAEEYEIIKTHTIAGYNQIMDVIDVLKISAAAARDHHEKDDGTGYHRITGKNINPFVRLIIIADIADALLAKRCYKESWSIKSVIDYLTENKNQFDQFIVKCFINSLDDVLLLY